MKISSLRWVKQTNEQQIISILAFPTLADPGLHIRVGGEGQSSRPLVKGGEAGLEKILFRPFGPQLVWSKNKGGAPSWIRLCTMQDVMHCRCIYSLFPSTAVLHIHFYGTRLRSKRSSLSSGETSTSVTSSKSCFAFSSPC